MNIPAPSTSACSSLPTRTAGTCCLARLLVAPPMLLLGTEYATGPKAGTTRPCKGTGLGKKLLVLWCVFGEDFVHYVEEGLVLREGLWCWGILGCKADG